jgi:hypothetical protein
VEILLRQQSKAASPYSTFKTKYRNDPAGFVRDCITWADGDGPAGYQAEAIGELPRRRRVTIRGPHGLGKTSLAAWVVLWFALTRDGDTDWKVPVTASAWRQLSHFLWPEVHKWARRLRWEVIGRQPLDERTELQTLNLKLSTGEAFALASDNAALIEGAHASALLYLFDESKTIPGETWDAAEGAMSAGDCYWLAISTPGEPNGRFHDIHSRKPGFEDWWVRHVRLEEAVGAGRISPEWAEQRKQQWGEKSAVYQNRVAGEFAASESDGVIPLAWVEAANQRWLEWQEAGKKLTGPMTAVGVDVARSGEDKTVMALRYGWIISSLKRFSREDTMQTTGRVVGILDAHGGKALIDVIGIGAGVFDRLREQGKKVVAFNAAEGTAKRDRSKELGFVNCRSAAWWAMREILETEPVALPPDDLLTGDLTAPHWRVVSGGKIQVEGKDEIRKRIGRSTDDGDAVVQAFWDAPAGWVWKG